MTILQTMCMCLCSCSHAESAWCLFTSLEWIRWPDSLPKPHCHSVYSCRGHVVMERLNIQMFSALPSSQQSVLPLHPCSDCHMIAMTVLSALRIMLMQLCTPALLLVDSSPNSSWILGTPALSLSVTSPKPLRCRPSPKPCRDHIWR